MARMTLPPWLTTTLSTLGRLSPTLTPPTLREMAPDCSAAPAKTGPFGLTAAEAKVAVQIGRGDMLADIAGEHGVSVATVRSQLASVFAKTQTRRQTELAMLLARIAILP